MKRLVPTLLLAAGAACAQQPADCPAPAAVGQRHMLGFWRAELDGRHGGTLLLEPHAEYRESLRGAIDRDGGRALVVGDIEDGDFTLEESADGKRISATWLGEVVAGSCGREIRGTWQGEGDKAPAVPFVLKKR